MSSPLKHLIVGTIGGAGIYAVSQNLISASGFFFGSWLIMDLDHVLAYWREIKFSPLKMINVKEFFKWNDIGSKRFVERPYLALNPLHTIEFFILWLCATLFFFYNGFIAICLWCLGAFAAMIVHLAMDRLELRMKTKHTNKYCYSVVQFWWRRNREREMVYEVKNIF